MTKFSQSASFVRGDTHKLEFTISSTSGSAVALTSASAVKWNMLTFGGSAVLKKSLTSGISLFNATTDGTDNGVRVTISSTDTEGFTVGLYQQELEATIGGNVLTLAQGTVELFTEHIST
jgi:hypothetical protein